MFHLLYPIAAVQLDVSEKSTKIKHIQVCWMYTIHFVGKQSLNISINMKPLNENDK